MPRLLPVLAFLAQCSLKGSSDLPDGWKELRDEASGKSYFLNSKTGETAWQLPGLPHLQGDRCLQVCYPQGERGRIATTCKGWLQKKADIFGASHPGQKSNACRLAHASMLQDCPGCEGCSVPQSGCLGEDAVISQTYFDCDAGFDNWEQTWTNVQQRWCCEHRSRACVGAANSNSPYDCEAGVAWAATKWSQEKKSWCCANEKKGCKFDCHSSQADWVHEWSEEMRTWCCSHQKLGCIAPAVYDCDEEDGGGISNWPEARKHYCCHEEGKACPTTTALQSTSDGAIPDHEGNPHDCKGRHWPLDKIQWCCTNKNIGCMLLVSTTPMLAMPQVTPLPTAEPYDCKAGLHDWRRGWSPHKQNWCCFYKKLGCPYDCKVNLDRWEEIWSAEQKTWCCAHQRKGCVALDSGKEHKSESYDCSGDSSAWGESQKTWCCRQQKVGCPTLHHRFTDSARYDCDSQEEWSVPQIAWCCRVQHKGCSDDRTSTTAGRSYDCMAGVNHWREQWTEEKKAYCCDRLKVGCPESSTTPAVKETMHEDASDVSSTKDFDCKATDANSQEAWSDEKKTWCCDHEGFGCAAQGDADGDGDDDTEDKDAQGDADKEEEPAAQDEEGDADKQEDQQGDADKDEDQQGDADKEEESEAKDEQGDADREEDDQGQTDKEEDSAAQDGQGDDKEEVSASTEQQDDADKEEDEQGDADKEEDVAKNTSVGFQKALHTKFDAAIPRQTYRRDTAGVAYLAHWTSPAAALALLAVLTMMVSCCWRGPLRARPVLPILRDEGYVNVPCQDVTRTEWLAT